MLPTLIGGKVCGGRGQVANLLDAILQERSEATGLDLVPGTLNVRVDDLDAAVAALEDPDKELPGPERLGPLRLWKVNISVRGGDHAEAYVVRHVHSRAPYLEVVSDVHFRTQGAEDGALVVLIRNRPGRW